MVRELGGDDHGDFHEAGNLAVAAPGGLVNHLVETLFLNGVGVAFACGEHMANLGPRGFGVAAEEVGADEVAVAGKGLARLFVHVEYEAFGVADGNGAVHLLGPLDFGNHTSAAIWAGVRPLALSTSEAT